MRCAAAAFVFFLSAPVLAQVNFRPTDRPIVTAENESWYRLGEPITFAGAFYYQAGPVVFFNGDTMVRTGSYLGIPIYVDTTIEPYSIVLVPIGRGQMQQYERPRDGELAGTSGSRPPSFPGGSRGYLDVYAGAPGAPTNLPLPIGDIGVYTPEAGTVATTGTLAPPPIDTTTREPVRRQVGRPFRYDSISFRFNGEKWVMAGPSVVQLPRGLTVIAEYKGFPVFAARGSERTRVYLPITPDRFAPFEPARR